MPGRDPSASGVLAFAFLIAGASYAAAQSPPPKWEVEVHAGFDAASNPSRGTARRTPAGEALVISSSLATRRIPSWMFHDGAALFNEVRLRIAPRPPAIVPLDPVLSRPGTERQGGGVFGARVARRMSSRVAAEFSIDVSTGGMALSAETLNDMEASRVGYALTFAGFFGNQLIDAGAVATILEKPGRHLFATGGLTFDLTAGGRVVPFITVGAGIESPRQEASTAAFRAGYEFHTSLIDSTMRETDDVTIRFEQGRRTVLLFGGGFRSLLSPASAIRADVRVHAGPNPARILVDTRTSTTLVAGVEAGRAAGGLPGLVFSTLPGIPSSLSGPALEGFEVFKGTSTRFVTTIAFGYSRRF